MLRKALSISLLSALFTLAVNVPAMLAATPPEVEALILKLSDPDETVRLKAAKELGRLKEVAKDAIPALKKASTDDSDEDVREISKKAIASIKEAVEKADNAAVDARLAPLIKDMKAKENKTRLAAISKLEDLGAAAKPAGAAIVEYGMMSLNKEVRDAANAAFEKIDPLVYREIVTVYYDQNSQKKDLAVSSLKIMGVKAKAAIPVIKGYYAHQLSNQNYLQSVTPIGTVEALVKIAPEDESVQRLVLDLVGSADPTSTVRGRIPGKIVRDRLPIVALMHELKIDDKQKITPLLSGVLASGDPGIRFAMVEELGKLRIENKDKYSALMTALARNVSERAQIIQELAKLGKDAKGAVPTLTMLKTDKVEAVRNAAAAAIEAIKE